MKKWFTRLMLVALVASGIVFAGCESDSGSSGAVNLTGTWLLNLTYTYGLQETWQLTLTQTGNSLVGSSEEVQGGALSGDPVPVTGTVNGNQVTLTEDWGGGETYIYNGTIANSSSMSGTADYNYGPSEDASVWTGMKQ